MADVWVSPEGDEFEILADEVWPLFAVDDPLRDYEPTEGPRSTRLAQLFSQARKK